MAKGAKYGNKNAAGPRGGGILGPKKPGLAGMLGFHELNAKGKKLMNEVNSPKNKGRILPYKIKL
jgi:hypothetical protein